MQKITTFLWFDKEAHEAATFYCSIFPDSKVLTIARYPEGGPGPAGSVMTVEFQLSGQRFMALNGGPTFKFTEAISLMVECETQKELDAYWDKLSAGGREVECGWLKDKYGLSWQIVPSGIGKMISDPKRGHLVAEAVWKMKKLDIAALRRVYESA